MNDTNFLLDAFEWRRWIGVAGLPKDDHSELISFQAHISRIDIPTEIYIYGKYRKVRYVFTKYLDAIHLAKYVAAVSDDPEGKLPAAFIKCY